NEELTILYIINKKWGIMTAAMDVLLLGMSKVQNLEAFQATVQKDTDMQAAVEVHVLGKEAMVYVKKQYIPSATYNKLLTSLPSDMRTAFEHQVKIHQLSHKPLVTAVKSGN